MGRGVSEPGVIGYLLDVGGLSARTDGAFRTALYEQLTAAGFEPSYVAAVLAVESSFNPNVQNAGGSPALGLLQWWRDYWPAVAARAGQADVPWEALRTMSAVDEVPFVVSYFQGTPIPKLGAAATPGDYYVATLLPAFVGAPTSWVVGIKGSTDPLRTPTGANTGLSLGKVYDQNAWLDVDRDGTMTVADLQAPTESLVRAARQKSPIAVYGSSPAAPPGASVAKLDPSLIASGVLFFCPSCGARSDVAHVVGRGVKS